MVAAGCPQTGRLGTERDGQPGLVSGHACIIPQNVTILAAVRTLSTIVIAADSKLATYGRVGYDEKGEALIVCVQCVGVAISLTQWSPASGALDAALPESGV